MHPIRANPAPQPRRRRPTRAAVSPRSILTTVVAFACGVGLLNLAQYFWLQAMRQAVEQSRHEMPDFNRPLEFEASFDPNTLIYQPTPIHLDD